MIPPTQREDCTAVEENLFNPAHSAIAPLAARLPNWKFRCAPAAGKHQGWSAPSSTIARRRSRRWSLRGHFEFRRPLTRCSAGYARDDRFLEPVWLMIRLTAFTAAACRSGSRAPVALSSRARHPAYSCRFDVFYIGVPHEDCDAIPFPHFVIEFCARHMLNNGSVRIEPSQPRPTPNGIWCMMPRMSDDAPSEDDCICCARWPPALRAAMRQAILRIPFTGPVCDDCLVAFMTNVWVASKQAKHH